MLMCVLSFPLVFVFLSFICSHPLFQSCSFHVFIHSSILHSLLVIFIIFPLFCLVLFFKCSFCRLFILFILVYRAFIHCLFTFFSLFHSLVLPCIFVFIHSCIHRLMFLSSYILLCARADIPISKNGVAVS